MTIIGIYKITSPSDKIYIGQSWNILHRWADYGKKTSKYQRMLCFSFNKYGKKQHKFEIIHELPFDITQDVLNIYEQFYMDLYRDAGFILLNSREAGSKGKLSDETKRRVSESLMGRPAWNKGLKGVVKMSQESKKKISDSLKSIKHTWKIGKKMPESTRKAINKANIGRVISPEQRAKLSASLKGKPYHGKNNGKVRSLEVRALHSKIQKERMDNKGQLNNMAKFTNDQILEIRTRKKHGESTYSLSKEYGMSYTNAKDIIAKRTWKHI